MLAPVPTQCMQAAKIRNPKSIEAYTGNLVMKVQVSYLFLQLRSKLNIQAKLGGVTHQVPISELPGMVKGKTILLGGNLGFVSFRGHEIRPRS
jgi:eukaryotic translation initiation factor 2C